MSPTRPIPSDSLLECPSCGLPAEITERFTLDGVPREVEHVKVVCVLGHWYTPAVDHLPPAKAGGDAHQAAAPSSARGVLAHGVLGQNGT